MVKTRWLALVAVLLLAHAGRVLGAGGADLKDADGAWRYTNALADETSPYLQQHAHNPVDWMPWGPAALQRARQEQKPIFLSIGYSTCYWCHVMERQVFHDPEIAGVLNERFVCIKVDREERPDIDTLYMTALQVSTRQGGWPLNVFLTPPAPAEIAADQTGGYGLKPYFCATYLPPAPEHGRPGFPQVVMAMHRVWEQKRPVLLLQAEKLAAAVGQVMAGDQGRGAVDLNAPADTALALMGEYDAQNGGFGRAPKFPQPGNLQLLLALSKDSPGKIRSATGHTAWRALLHTLDRMARGGMYDQAGGGFHRYSTDAEWIVPHFEKMLYDNGQLLSLYAGALSELRQRRPDGSAHADQFERVIRETADYLLREMLDDSGAFWSAQDAEVGAREGASYVWTRQQLDAALPDAQQRSLASKLYGLDSEPNFRDPHAPTAPPAYVLYMPKPLLQVATELGMPEAQARAERERINSRLKAVRDQREQPGTDDKVLASWNGLAIKGLAEAGQVLDEPRYLEAAERAADAVLRHMAAPDGGLMRSMRNKKASVPAFLEDYTHMSAGLLALARINGSAGEHRTAQAETLTRYAINNFGAGSGGYYNTLPDQADLFVRVRSTYDGATPSGNAVMQQNLLELYAQTQEEQWLERAVRDLRSLAGDLRKHGKSMAHTLTALNKAAGIQSAADLLTRGAGEEAREDPRVAVAIEWAGEGELSIRLTIQQGLHLNVHQVSDALLIPTSVTLLGPGVLTPEYPAGELRRYPYAEEAIRVYEGEVQISAKLVGSAAGSRIKLRYQACSDSACLEPAEIVIAVPGR